MDVPPVQPPSKAPPATGDRQSTASGDLPFSSGQRFFARVIQLVGPGEAVLDLGGQRLLTSVPIEVAEGQVLHVAIKSLGPVVELTLEAPPMAFSERAYALAAVRQALANAPAGSTITTREIEALLGALARGPSGEGSVAATPAAQLARSLQPLPLGTDTGTLIEALRARVLLGGAGLEHRLGLTGQADDAERAEDGLRGDLRALLAAIAKETAGSPDLESTRLRLVDDAMRRQLEVALHVLGEREVRVDLPVLLGQQAAEARLRVRSDREPDGEGGQALTHTIALTLPHPDLGPVHVVARFRPGELHVRVAVSHAAAAHALEPLRDDFTSRLHGAGFAHVGVAIDVDPHAATGPVDPPDDPLPGGSVLSALA